MANTDTKGLGIEELSLYDALIKHYLVGDEDREYVTHEQIDELFNSEPEPEEPEPEEPEEPEPEPMNVKVNARIYDIYSSQNLGATVTTNIYDIYSSQNLGVTITTSIRNYEE